MSELVHLRDALHHEVMISDRDAADSIAIKIEIARLALARLHRCFDRLERATVFEKAAIAEEGAKLSAVALEELLGCIGAIARRGDPMNG